jgi:transcription elongation factor Elf1
MKKKTRGVLDKSYKCPHCGSHMFRYVGLQWWPEDILRKANTWGKCLHDDKHPGEGALKLYICEGCKTSKLNPAPR